MKPCEIAVIVPVHNAAAFLTACTDAIAAQKFDAFQCILVDDGSTDGSPALCDAIAAGDQRFVAMHQPNSGVCAARTAGLRRAAAEIRATAPDALRESVNAFYYEKLVYLASMILRRANADDYRAQLCELKVAIAAGEKDPQLGRNPQLPRSIQLAAFLTLHAPRLWRWACKNFLKDRQ